LGQFAGAVGNRECALADLASRHDADIQRSCGFRLFARTGKITPGTGRMRCALHGFIEEQQMRGKSMVRKLTMMYWKGDRYWLGKLLEHPEIMTQGQTLAELEENLKDAFRLMAMAKAAGAATQ
jgi:hypothetical protein